MNGLLKGSGLRIAIAILAAVSVFGVAGASSASGPISAPLIAYWDGTSWTQQTAPNPDGSSILTTVAAVSPTDAWALGTSGDSSSGESALALHWDGLAWLQVPMPLPVGATELHLTGMAIISSSDIWAVGGWDDNGPGNGFVPLIEHWNGLTWSIVQSRVRPHGPLVNKAAQLNSVAAVSTNDVWAVGYSGSGSRHPLTLHWDGTAWTRVPGPHMGPHAALSGVTAITTSKVWAVGSTQLKIGKHLVTVPFALRWNGKLWQRMNNIHVGSLLAVTGSENNIWAVGYWRSGNYDFGSACGNCHGLPLIEHWNGKHWKTFSGHSNYPRSIHQPLMGIAMTSGNELWAVGDHEDVHSLRAQSLIEHFSNGRWSTVKSMNPASDDWLSGVAAASPSAVWAVGAYFPGS